MRPWITFEGIICYSYAANGKDPRCCPLFSAASEKETAFVLNYVLNWAKCGNNTSKVWIWAERVLWCLLSLQRDYRFKGFHLFCLKTSSSLCKHSFSVPLSSSFTWSLSLSLPLVVCLFPWPSSLLYILNHSLHVSLSFSLPSVSFSDIFHPSRLHFASLHLSIFISLDFPPFLHYLSLHRLSFVSPCNSLCHFVSFSLCLAVRAAGSLLSILSNSSDSRRLF